MYIYIKGKPVLLQYDSDKQGLEKKMLTKRCPVLVEKKNNG